MAAFLRRDALQAQDQGLFRAATATQILLHLLKGAITSMETYGSLPHVCSLDTFISHSSSCPRWMKVLAICHYHNLDLAIALSILTWALTFFIMLLRAGGFTNLVEGDLLQNHLMLVALPMAVFFITYFGGHVRATGLWFDGVCVSDAPLSKLQTLQAIPAFVAASSKMLVLWDASFFDRLWCNYEIAVFAKTSHTQAMHVVPIWVPIWCLFSLLLIVVEVCLFALVPSSLQFDLGSRLSLFRGGFRHQLDFGLPIIVNSIPLVWFCFQRQRHHRSMLDQMSQFDIRNARCTLETDRVVIERMVLELFDEANEAPVSVGFGVEEVAQEAPLLEFPAELREITSYPNKDQIWDEFNAYVRGPLRERVISELGSDVRMPLKLCVVGILPLFFLAPLYACEARTCKDYASSLGMSSTTLLMVWTTFANEVQVPCTHCLTFPLQMRGSEWITSLVPNKALQIVCIFCLGLALECLRLLFICVMGGLALVVIAMYSPWWLAAFLACLGILCWHFWFLFLKPDRLPSSRGLR